MTPIYAILLPNNRLRHEQWAQSFCFWVAAKIQEHVAVSINWGRGLTEVRALARCLGVRGHAG